MGKAIDPQADAERKMRRLRASLPDEVLMDPRIEHLIRRIETLEKQVTLWGNFTTFVAAILLLALICGYVLADWANLLS